jgi:hypothetical protein
MHDEAEIRLGFFFGIFVLVAVLEILRPRRALTTSKTSRWFANLGIIALNPVSVRLIFPVLPVGMALLAAEQLGVTEYVALPYWQGPRCNHPGFVDLSQHVLHHAIPILWRCMVPRGSRYDVTTGVHPIEILLSMASSS